MTAIVIPLQSLRTPYLVSRSYERLGPCHACDGCEDCVPDGGDDLDDQTASNLFLEERGFRFADEPMSLDDLASEARTMGPFEPSSSEPHEGMWWSEYEAHANRDHFELGIDERDSLHVRRLDGRPMTARELTAVHARVMRRGEWCECRRA
jgi:hypothetical protein